MPTSSTVTARICTCPVLWAKCVCALGVLWARTWLSHLSSLILSKPGYKLRFDNIHYKGTRAV
ncbi:hypothetical protein DPMN_171195 [Dreissena polymorpha]|uniref:Uncharacterized protein n=1 Tax=Dreissena polymorpha TaxID=45954 RepID=A0A9D4DXM8_DREPO|nr:hypothetical protein DPMN_171195 [Dreissena polymorpha]